MVLKLYGWRPSPYVQNVMIVLHEKHVPFEFINVDLCKGEQRRPEYSDVHPFTQVPVIVCISHLNKFICLLLINIQFFEWQDDNGFMLYESRAICRYLEEKYSNRGTKLNPTDLHKRALVDQASWTEAYHFSLHAKPIWFEHVVRQ
jgi:glutathione S-transferase